MKTTMSTPIIPAWKARWNEIRNREIEKAQTLAEEHASRDIESANTTIFCMLHNGESPAIKMTDKAFNVLCLNHSGHETRFMSCNFDYINGLCPDAKAEFIRVYHILLIREYGEFELDTIHKLVPDPVSSEYTPA